MSAGNLKICQRGYVITAHAISNLDRAHQNLSVRHAVLTVKQHFLRSHKEIPLNLVKYDGHIGEILQERVILVTYIQNTYIKLESSVPKAVLKIGIVETPLQHVIPQTSGRD